MPKGQRYRESIHPPRWCRQGHYGQPNKYNQCKECNRLREAKRKTEDPVRTKRYAKKSLENRKKKTPAKFIPVCGLKGQTKALESGFRYFKSLACVVCGSPERYTKSGYCTNHRVNNPHYNPVVSKKKRYYSNSFLNLVYKLRDKIDNA